MCRAKLGSAVPVLFGSCWVSERVRRLQTRRRLCGEVGAEGVDVAGKSSLVGGDQEVLVGMRKPVDAACGEEERSVGEDQLLNSAVDVDRRRQAVLEQNLPVEVVRLADQRLPVGGEGVLLGVVA